MLAWQSRTCFKCGLHADKTTLCAFTSSSSVASVTSKKSASSRSSRNAEDKFASKSFQRRQKFSVVPMIVPFKDVDKYVIFIYKILQYNNGLFLVFICTIFRFYKSCIEIFERGLFQRSFTKPDRRQLLRKVDDSTCRSWR